MENKIKNKLRIKAIRRAYLALEKKARKSVKKNKNNFINL